MLKSGVSEEVGLVYGSDILLLFSTNFINVKIYDRRRIDRTAVGGGCGRLVSSKEINVLWLAVHFAPAPQALALSGCWTTSIRYRRVRPSFVCRSIVPIISLEPLRDAIVLGIPGENDQASRTTNPVFRYGKPVSSDTNFERDFSMIVKVARE